MGRPGVINRRDVSVTDTVESNVGILGDIRYEVGTAGGAWYQCVQAGATFSHGQPYQAASAIAATDNAAYSVGVNFNTNVAANGVYNAQTVTIAASAYFWGQYAGKGIVLNDDGASIVSNAAARASDSGIIVAASTIPNIAFRTINSIAATATGVAHIFCNQI